MTLAKLPICLIRSLAPWPYPSKLLIRALPGNVIPSRYRLVTFAEVI